MINNSNSILNGSSPKSFWDRVKNVFVPKVEQYTETPKIEEVIMENETPDHEKKFDGIGRIYKINIVEDISNTKKQFLESITEIGSDFRKLGELDGALEQKTNAIYDIVKTRVSHIRAYIDAVFQGEKDSAETELLTKKEIFKDAENDYKSQIEYTISLKESYRWNYKNFSFVMGVIYIIVAILLVFADIPLSYLLTKEAFALEELWQTVLMSIGIALCTIYVKIYYDEYFAFPMEKSVSQFKAANLKGIGDNIEEITQVKKEWTMRFRAKTTILILSMLTIVCLGVVRYNFFIAKKIVEKTETSTTQTELIFPNNEQNDSSNSEQLNKAYKHWSTPLAFILITLLFPMIGGVCASLGSDKIQNHKELVQTDKNCELKKDIYLKALKDCNEVEKKLKNWESYLNWSSKEGTFIKEYTSFFIACYVHGYERGIIQANLGKDIFTKAEELRKKLMARQIFSVTKSISSNDLYADFQTLINNQSNGTKQ
jgi:hypothetical protein